MSRECVEWSAVGRKLSSVSWKEKGKLTAKLMLRLVGVKKPLFLGGYSSREDALQRQQDERTAKYLAEKNVISARQETIATERATGAKAAGGRLSSEEERLLQERNSESYIALVTEFLDRGGLEEVIRMLGLSFQERQLQVRVLVLQDGGDIAEDLQRHRIPVEIFHGDHQKLEAYLAAHRPWIVNTHYILDLEALKLFRGIPVLEDIHNMYVFQNEAGLRLEREKAGYIHRYIAVSDLVGRIFRKKVPGVSQERITVIGNALREGKSVGRTREQVRQAMGIQEDALVFLAPGSVDHRKNQLGLLRAWSVAVTCLEGRAVLWIAGQGTDPEYEKKVGNMIRERGLENSVRLLGYRRDVRDLMGAADAVVLASYYEGWSMAATESLSLGVPILHADCGSARELTAGGANGILVPGAISRIEDEDRFVLYDKMYAGVCENVEQLAEAFLCMARDRELWKQRKKDIAEYARVEFSGERMTEGYLREYLRAYQETHGER